MSFSVMSIIRGLKKIELKLKDIIFRNVDISEGIQTMKILDF